MTEEFDILEAFQQMRQRLHDTRQPRNLGSIAEALWEPYIAHEGLTVTPLPPDWRLADGSWIGRDESYETSDDLEDEDDDDSIDVMDYMAWAYLPEKIKDDICTNFYHGIPAIHQVLLTIPDENQRGGMNVTGATVEIYRDNHMVQLRLGNEVIAWYTSASPVIDDKYHPIFFVYDYEKLGRFFLGAAQLLWNALGYPVCIESERYIWDDETTPWEMESDEELRNYAHNRIKQFGQLSGNFGVFKKRIRNARRRRNLY